MSWTWRYEGDDDAVITAETAVEFDSKSDAESWIGEEWRALRARGVRQVFLVEDGRVEYGPMSLPAERLDRRGPK